MIKYKKWINTIHRTALSQNSRFNKIRLEKNERVENFEKKILLNFKKQINSRHLNTYPETYSLYESLAKFHRLKIKNFLITAGSDAGIRNCFDVFVHPKSKVVITEPTFAMVDVYSKLFNAQVLKIKYDKKLNLKVEKIINQIDSKTSLVIIANPNSPTGTVLDVNEIKKIILKAKSKRAAVLIDEAYFGFYNLSSINLIKKYSNLIISRTFSKGYGMAGLRVGYLIGSTKIIDLLTKFKPMYEINSLGILLAKTLIKNRSIFKSYIHKTQKCKSFLDNYFRKKKIRMIKTHANFILIEIKKNRSRIIKELEKKGILIGKKFPIKGMHNFVRITVGPIKIIKKIIPIFEKYY